MARRVPPLRISILAEQQPHFCCREPVGSRWSQSMPPSVHILGGTSHHRTTYRLVSFFAKFSSITNAALGGKEHHVKTTEAQASKSEIELFKSIHSRPDEMRGTDGELRKVAGKPKKSPKRKVAAKDSATLGGLVRDLSGDASPLNGHGARSGAAAHGPGSNDAENPPAQGEINQRELRAKQNKGYGVGSDAGVDELRKIHQRGPSGRLA